MGEKQVTKKYLYQFTHIRNDGVTGVVYPLVTWLNIRREHVTSTVGDSNVGYDLG